MPNEKKKAPASATGAMITAKELRRALVGFDQLPKALRQAFAEFDQSPKAFRERMINIQEAQGKADMARAQASQTLLEYMREMNGQ